MCSVNDVDPCTLSFPHVFLNNGPEYPAWDEHSIVISASDLIYKYMILIIIIRSYLDE